MRTESTDERLSAYLDGDLSADEVAALEHELAHDAHMRADLDALRLVVHTLRDDGPVRAPLGFHAAVMDRIEAEHPAAPFWQRFLNRPFGIPAQGWGVVLAAAAVLVVVQVGRDGAADTPLADQDGPVWRDVVVPEEAPAAVKLPTKADVEPAPTSAKPSPLPAPQTTPSPKAALKKALTKEEAAAKQAPMKEEAAAEQALQIDKATTKGVEPDEHTGKVPVLRTPLTGLTLLTREPAALREVLALVARFGGTVSTPSGGEVTHATLESAEESVVVSIPSAQLAAFQSALESLGSVKASFNPDRLYGGGMLEVPLTFKLVGGSSGTGDEPLAPASKRRASEAELKMGAPD